MYSGYFGLAWEANSVYGTARAAADADGLGPFAGMTLGLSQSSIEASSSPAFRTPTRTTRGTRRRPLFRQIGGTAPAGSAIAHARSSEPSLEEERQEYLYRALSMGFGLEGLASGATAAQLGDRAMDWLLDSVTWPRVRVGRPGKRIDPHGGRGLERRRIDHAVPVGLRRRHARTSRPTARRCTTSTSTAGPTTCAFEATDGLGHRTVGRAACRTVSAKD